MPPLTGPVRSGLWNPHVEAMSPEAVAAFQSEALSRQLAYVAGRSPFYARKWSDAGFDPDRVASIQDLAAAPYTEKDELRVSQASAPPLGSHAAAALVDVVRIHSSSGTTGTPSFIGITRHDAQLWTESLARVFWCEGVRPSDVFIHAVGLSFFVGGLPVKDGIEEIGATFVPIGTGATDRLVQATDALGGTVLFCTPSYAVYLAETLLARGRHPRSLGFRLMTLGAEPGGAIPEVRAHIEELYGARVTEAYGNSDVIPAFAATCEAGEGNHFLTPDFAIAELIDPDTGSVRAWEDGARGELVTTNLGRECCPLVRFRTRDHIIVRTSRCRCGRTGVRWVCEGPHRRHADRCRRQRLAVGNRRCRDQLRASHDRRLADPGRLRRPSRRAPAPHPHRTRRRSRQRRCSPRRARRAASSSADREHRRRAGTAPYARAVRDEGPVHRASRAKGIRWRPGVTILRVSRQQERRLEIARAAVRLFERQGLAETTVEMIAAEASVSPRTFFRYFETKESAAFPDHAARVADLDRRLDARLPSDTPIRDVVEVSRRSATEYFANPELYHRRYRLLRSDEVLRNLERVFDRAYEDRIVAFLTACDIDRVTACACAAAVVAVVNAALDLWACSARGNAKPARAALKSGLETVLAAFSRVAPGLDEVSRPRTHAPLAVLVGADDPLREELLAAVKRGAVVIDTGRPAGRGASDGLVAS